METVVGLRIVASRAEQLSPPAPKDRQTHPFPWIDAATTARRMDGGGGGRWVGRGGLGMEGRLRCGEATLQSARATWGATVVDEVVDERPWIR